ncbi:SCO family protein [Stigmatella aurantiaca]|uniref:SCO1/SenC family protein n=2 Tax=Stigmatella aurantiaca (strain DW4/3-1) TaxID=378806 RepID=E3FNS1_STIAD|nr:SCO family protein [Stigmatella aurantiaca]ADO68150.1 SCO1/SenC family protein [Stigmatella aurantiaca DW4/3-1]
MSANTSALAPSPPRLSRHPAFWAALTVMVLGLGVMAVGLLSHPSEPLPKLGTLPDFTFTRENGTPWGLSQLRGHPFVANFIFTRCPTICPAFTRRMAHVQKQTDAAGPALQLVSFSVDPTYDTPARLAEYAQKHGANPARWSFLTGDYARLKDTVVQGFRISMGRESMDEADVMGIFHGNHFVLVDATGEIRGYYDSSDDEAFARMLKDVERLGTP